MSADGSVATQSFAISVDNVNEPAVIGGVRSGAVSEDGILYASGQLTVVDPDSGESSFQAGITAGAYGSLSLLADGHWTYTLENSSPAVQRLAAGETVSDTLTVRSVDETTSTLAITVTGAADLNEIVGTARGEVISGTAGDDRITPSGGADLVRAGNGDDVIVPTRNDGPDLYDGGRGSDTVDYSQLTRGVDVRLAGVFGIDGGTGVGSEIGVDILLSIENIIGSQAADRIDGDGGANVLKGGLGNDHLSGNGGADRIEGGPGADVLAGGAGNDRFVFAAPSADLDTIADFSRGRDLIEISAAGFGHGLVADAAVAMNAAANPLTSISGPNGVFLFDTAGPNAGTIYWDANGGSGADAVALVKLQGVTSLLPSDFHVV